MNIHFTPISSNSKTGPMLTTTQSKDTCSPGCPFNHTNEGGCYAEYGPLKLHWDKVSSGERTKTWAEFLEAIKGLWKGSVWRMSQAGDLPGVGNRIDATKLRELIAANRGKQGFTYTHKKLTKTNKALIKEANDNGFTINLSANDLRDADRKVALGIGPVAVPVSADPAQWPKATPGGNPIVICLHDTKNLQCTNCRLCAVPGRKSIVGFPAHGNGKRKIEARVS